MATTTFFPFVVAALAMRTKTFGSSAPLTSARPEDLRKDLRFMMGLSLSLEFGTAEDEADDGGRLRFLARFRGDGRLRLGRQLAADERLGDVADRGHRRRCGIEMDAGQPAASKRKGAVEPGDQRAGVDPDGGLVAIAGGRLRA